MPAERFHLGQGGAIEVTLRRSPRARRLSLRVSALDGRVTMTVPARANAAEARAFAEERLDWIARARERAPEHVPVTLGSILPVEGRPVTLVQGASPRLQDARFHVPGPRAGIAARAFLRTLARERLARAADHHASAIGKSYAALTLRDTRSRWGSCTSEGRLMFSWRLIMAPPDVLDYVVAHEVAHLERMDHSPAFWELVQRLCPGWRSRRDWLRSDGATLHRYRFED